MSKTTLTTQANLNKTTGKPNTIQRETFKKLTLDLNGTEFKSALTNSTLSQEKPLFSPTSPNEKAGLAKSPHAKNNSIMSPAELLDAKESSKLDKKIHPQTTKATGSPQISAGLSKGKKAPTNEKVAPSKLKEYQIKGMFPGSETFLASKTVQNKDGNRINLNLYTKDNKQKIMEEPPKKASMPITLAMTLNQVYSNTGSSSHRTALNSAKSDHNNPPLVYAPFNRKNSKKLDSEPEPPQINTIVGNKHAQTQHLTNSVLSELGSAPSERSKTMAKINVNGMSGFHTSITTDNNKIERVPSPQNKTITGQSSQYNDLLKLLNDKNKEIQRLSQDKIELKTTLETLTGEVRTFKKMKGLLKEKEAVIGNLQASLVQAASDSDILRKELQKESLLPEDISPIKPQSRVEQKRGSKGSNGGDLEGIKHLIGQLKSLTEGLDEVDVKAQNVTNPQAPPTGGLHSYPLDFSQKGILNTTEDAIDKRKGESPYYDERVGVEVKKNGAIFKKMSIPNQNSKRIGNDVVIKKGDSLLGTPGRMRISTDKVENQFIVQPHTTSGADIDMLKRKFSHDPKLSSEGLADFLNKKRSVAEVGISASHRENKGGVSGEHMDIGKALTGLKDKIARVLNRHREDHVNLKQTQEMCLQKLNELLNREMMSKGKA